MDKLAVQPVFVHRFAQNRCCSLELPFLITTQFSMNVARLGPALLCLAADGIFNDQTVAVSLLLIEKNKFSALRCFAVRSGFEEHSPEVQRGLIVPVP